MKLWLILYMAGQVGATWGPLPYDMKECLSRKAEYEADMDEKLVPPLPPGVLPRDQWAFECRLSEARLQLGEPRP